MMVILSFWASLRWNIDQIFQIFAEAEKNLKTKTLKILPLAYLTVHDPDISSMDSVATHQPTQYSQYSSSSW